MTRTTYPTRRLIDRQDPAHYVPAARSDIRATFRAQRGLDMFDDRHRRHELRQSPTFAASSQHLADTARSLSHLTLVRSAPMPFMEPPPRRMYPSVPRSGPVRIATRARRDRIVTAALFAGLLSCVAVAGVLWFS